MTDLFTSWKRPCPRCRVDRHDRCIGAQDCGCTDPTHQAQAADNQLAGTGFYAVGEEGTGGVYHLDPDDETVIIEMSTRQYAQLLQAAQAQERDPGVVLRRALEHYLTLECRWGIRCRHTHDERGGDDQGGAEEQVEDRAPDDNEDPPPAPLVADPAMMTEVIRP